jgi:hypothetical protein
MPTLQLIITKFHLFVFRGELLEELHEGDSISLADFKNLDVLGVNVKKRFSLSKTGAIFRLFVSFTVVNFSAFNQNTSKISE